MSVFRSGPPPEQTTSLFHRKADVIFSERLGRGAGTGHVIQFGELAAMVERILLWETMQHGSHPPREALHFPDTTQADLRIVMEQVIASSGIKMFESPRQYLNVGDREVQSLGSSRRNDVRRVSRQEEPAVLHGLDHEATHAGHAFLQNLAFRERPSIRSETSLKFLPDRLVAPQIDVLVGPAL